MHYGVLVMKIAGFADGVVCGSNDSYSSHASNHVCFGFLG
jgi:hypothetical protein